MITKFQFWIVIFLLSILVICQCIRTFNIFHPKRSKCPEFSIDTLYGTTDKGMVDTIVEITYNEKTYQINNMYYE